VTTVQYRAYKLRLYPTPSQEHVLYQQATAQRFVWNWALGVVNDHYQETGKRLRATDLNTRFTKAKREREDMRWLDKPSGKNPGGVGINVSACQMTFRYLDKAWDAFFRGLKTGQRAGKPNFKARGRSLPSISFPFGVYTDGRRAFIPAVGKVRFRGYDDIALDRPGQATVTRNAAGQWYMSKLVKIEQPPLTFVADNPRVVGIDFGIRRLATTSDGEIIENPKHLERMERKLKKLDRALSRAQKGSNRREITKAHRARAYNDLANARREHIHELTTRLIRENDVIVLGCRDISGMIRQAKKKDDPDATVSRILQLPKRINDAAWGEARRQLEYKAEWSGKTVIVLDETFPATRMCSTCGAVNDEISSLTHREWDCGQCGAHHDIDINAAINIKREGLRQLAEKIRDQDMAS